MRIGSAGGGQSSAGESATFYRFTDASGRVHIVDSLDLVPQAGRSHVERIRYGEQSPGLPPALRVMGSWQTVALGLGALILLWLLARRLPGALRVGLRFGLLALAICLLASAYFGWLRQTTQHATATLASPTQLIDDAKSAVEKLNARLRVQQAELKEAEQAK